jgi:hypothetical protein
VVRMSTATKRSATAASTNHNSMTPSNIEPSLALRRAVAQNDDGCARAPAAIPAVCHAAVTMSAIRPQHFA